MTAAGVVTTAETEIERLLRERQPSTLLLLSRDPRWPALCQPLCQQLISRDDLPLNDMALNDIGHVDMALVIDLTEALDKRDAIELLGRLRTLHTDLLYVLTAADPRWSLTDWLALALQRAGEFDDDGRLLTLYRYDLGSYNRKRSWNNSQYWANPDNWGKYRW